MKKGVFFILVPGFLLFLRSTPVHAISLGFVPPSQTVAVGSPVNVDVFVEDPGGILVGLFDFFVDFDPTILDLVSVTFDSFLGDPVSEALTIISPGVGTVETVEVSFLLPADLALLQDGVSDFRLFTLTFNTLAVGTSALEFSPSIIGFLGDALGNPITLDSVGAGGVSAIPEPSTLLLLGSGLVGLVGLRKKRTRYTERGHNLRFFARA